MYPINVKKSNYKVINFEIIGEGIKFVISWLKSFKSLKAMMLFYVKSFYV